MQKFKLFINNTWVDAEGGKTFLSYDPSTGEPIAELASASKADVDRAVAVAKKTFDSGVWSELSGDERAKYMLKAVEIMRRRLPELAKWEALDTGKPIRETEMIDITYAMRAMEYFANMAREIQGQVIPIPNESTFTWVTYEPFGVVAAITPWNFPLHIGTRAICPAMAAGNTVVAKASSLSPITNIILGEIIAEAGFPPGVVNLISGPGNPTGQALIDHPDIAMITFTGSLEIGRKIMEAAAKAPVIKKVLLELGGKGPFIVEADANIEDAVNQVLKGFCLMQGEVCCASTRLYCHEDVYDRFMKMLVERAKRIKIGPIMERSTQMGSLINREQLEQVDRRVKAAVQEGAKLLTGGEPYTAGACAKGSYYPPTVLEVARNGMKCVQEEIFGPVLVALKYSKLDDAIAMANANQYALGASVYTENVRTLFYAAKKIEAGIVWLNTNVMSKIEAPYGGNKNSGLGREDGIIGLMEYLKVKTNVLSLSKSIDNFYDF
ncbi:MAG: aldehyde dehydrogenase family protein [Spirochaetota bacterium]